MAKTKWTETHKVKRLSKMKCSEYVGVAERVGRPSHIKLGLLGYRREVGAKMESNPVLRHGTALRL